MYTGLGPHAMHFYNHGTQFPRRRDGDTVALRSPILEEFRTNRTRKWELCVGVSLVFFFMKLKWVILRTRISMDIL